MSSTKAFNTESWKQTADYILAPLVAEGMVNKNYDFYWKSVQAGLQSHHFPNGQARTVYNTVSALIMDKKPVHITTLQTALNGDVSSDYVMLLYTTYQKGSTLGGAIFEANIATLKDFGERAQMIKKLSETQDALIKGDTRNHDTIVSDAIAAMVSSGSDTIENETAIEMGKVFEQYMSEVPSHHMNTGVRLVDSWINGLGNGDFVSIVAPMKQRKTSLLLNMMLSMARSGKSVSLLMFESNKLMVNAMVVSMLAVEWLIKNNLYDANDTNKEGVIVGKANQIWASTLVKLQGRYPSLGKIRAQAISAGIQEFNKLSTYFRVYDRTKKGGSLNDNASIHRVCLRDKALYETDFIAIDHAQRINEKGSDYEKLTTVVPYLESLARREDIAMCLLAQVNANNAEGTGDSHISGVRGGTVLDEAVDYMLITGYKQLLDEPIDNVTRSPNDVLKIGLQHSRYGDGGSHRRAFVAIDPNSGLILHGGRPLTNVNPHGFNNTNPKFD